ncbi:diacylglycerol kinase family lipid kinase [Nibrella saemangeumensis]|uniref:Diacylglycerol kinase family lipid kinase n=1 Tax=Nibrella saemangeumensis TaxID=1084526 RepID=A0ABP8NH38_9BACT
MSGTLSPEQKDLLIDFLVLQAKEVGYLPEVIITKYPGHATELATDAIQRGIRRIIAIGGDGTVNETAQALRHTATALGIVPIGSGNGLARHLGIPLVPKEAILKALNGRPVVIDSGEVETHPFFCTAGFGFEAVVAHQFALQPVRGLTTYARTAYQQFWQYKPEPLLVNGQEKTLFSLTFANAAQFGNNAWIAPKANIADGLLDQCELQSFPLQALVVLSWQLFNRTLDQSVYYRSEPVRTATIQGKNPLLLHADGEPITLLSDTCQVRILPGSLLVLL